VAVAQVDALEVPCQVSRSAQREPKGGPKLNDLPQRVVLPLDDEGALSDDVRLTRRQTACVALVQDGALSGRDLPDLPARPMLDGRYGAICVLDGGGTRKRIVLVLRLLELSVGEGREVAHLIVVVVHGPLIEPRDLPHERLRVL